MATKTQICNIALGHLGVGTEIANIDTENSQEARSCRRFYDLSRDQVLRDFPWPFAKKVATLNLIEEDPTTEWAYSYQYPSDCIRFRRILSGTRNDTRQSRVPHKIYRGAGGKVIYTDTEDAVGEYTLSITEEGMFDQDFVVTLSFLLAAYIAPTLTRGDPFKRGQRSTELYLFSLSQARANSLHEEQAEEEPQSEFIRTREG